MHYFPFLDKIISDATTINDHNAYYFDGTFFYSRTVSKCFAISASQRNVTN